MKYEAIIFDLDGVICHTDVYHYLAWKKLADKLGVYFDEHINHRLRGISRMESFEIILEQYKGDPLSHEEKIKYTEEKNHIYQKLLRNMTPDDVSPEVIQTLQDLRSLGLKLAIGSSSKNARLILNQIGLENFFDAISDGNNISKSKPDPEVFLKASEYLGIPPKKCLVVEDAVSGLQAALSCNMDCAAIGEATKSSIGTYKLTTFSDLLNVVG